jgi:predicted TPR repeat methyltransferase
VLGNLGITLLRLRRFEDALPLLQQATVAEPDYVEAWTCLGMVLEALGRWEAAVGVYETTTTLLRTSASPWLRMAACLTRLGRPQKALRAYDHALIVAPEDAQAWTSKGGLLRELQRLDEAAQCFEKALARGGNVDLNQYYLASVRGSAGSYASHASNTPSAPPRQYVEGLFDDYAQEFQQHVTGKLRYQGHTQLLEPLIAAQHRFERALDLGCGTGLCAPLLHPIAKVIDGVDLSQAMLRKAHKLGLYRDLVHADIGTWLASTQERADLIVAADVFIYVGELSAVFAAVRRVLFPGGCFAFTVEEPQEESNEEPNEERDWQLLPSLRYAHSEHYIRRLAYERGFTVEQLYRAPIREDQGQPVEGLYVYLR